jgi:uncharacterized protein (DUF305 family)
MRITRVTRRFLPVIAVSALLLSGCGQDADPVVSAGTVPPQVTASATADAGGQDVEPSNTVDVEFATGMIPHHGQAIDMADLALEKTSNPQVKALAGKIKEAQTPEIETLSTMLIAWGKSVPDATEYAEAVPGMGHGAGGMMTAEQLGDLDAATGATFDRSWVDLMIAHHRGAVRMSKGEIRGGQNPKAQQLAQTIADAQTAEIAELRSLRAGLEQL